MATLSMQEDEEGPQYSKHSHLQAQLNQGARDFLSQAGQQLLLADVRGPINIADFGCSSGANSATELRNLVEAVRQKQDGADISIYHNDLPGNNFSALFDNVKSLAGHSSVSHVHLYAQGKDFYTTCFHADFLDIAYSGMSLMWGSQDLPVVGNTIWQLATDLLDPAAADTAQQAKEVAASDWQHWLALRARELRSGGFLVVTMMTRETDKDCASQYQYLEFMQASWQGLAADGILSPSEAGPVSIPGYLRDDAEVCAPFLHCSEIQASYELLEVKPTYAEHPAWAEYQHDKDAAKLAQTLAAAITSVFGNYFRQRVQHRHDVSDIMQLHGVKLEAHFLQQLEQNPAAVHVGKMLSHAVFLKRK